MPSSAQLKLGASYVLVRMQDLAYKDSWNLENNVSQVEGLLDRVRVRLTKLIW